MTKALLVRPDHTTKRVEINDWKDITAHLGCRLFTVIPNVNNHDFDLLGDDEGLLVDPEFIEENYLGSAYYGTLQHGSPIVGNVLAVGPTDDEGEMTDLTDKQLDRIERACQLVGAFMVGTS